MFSIDSKTANTISGRRAMVESLEMRFLLSAAPLALAASAGTPGNQIAASVNINGNSDELRLFTVDGSNIDPSKPTWIVIHGWDSSPTDSGIANLAAGIAAQRPGEQVLLLDWSAAADTGQTDPEDAQDATPAVGQWAAQTLTDAGFVPAHIQLVGHSYGTYVAYALAASVAGGVGGIIALDPGANSAPLASFNVDDTVNFANVSKWSWSFYSSGGLEPGMGPSLDDSQTAGTAKQPFVVNGSDHTLGTVLYAAEIAGTDLISERFDLASFLAQESGSAGPWLAGQFDSSSDVTSGSFDAVLTADASGDAPATLEYISNQTDQITSETLASSGLTAAGTLVATGTSGDDQIAIANGSPVTLDLNGQTTDFAAGSVSSVVVNAGAGNDLVTVGHGLGPALIHGAQGDDTLTGNDANDTIRGGAGNDLIYGGPGNDLLFGGLGNNTIHGGKGNDTITGGATGANLLLGGAGDDLFFAINGNADTLVGGAGANTAHVDTIDVIPNNDIATILYI